MSQFNPNALIPSPKLRKYIYLCAAALLLAATFYRLITAQEAAMWIAVASVFLGVGGLGLAAVNTPKDLPASEELELTDGQKELEDLADSLGVDIHIAEDNAHRGE